MTLIQWITKGYAATQQSIANLQLQIDTFQKSFAKSQELEAALKLISTQQDRITALEAKIASASVGAISPENVQAYNDMALQINTIRDLLRTDHNMWIAMGPKLEALK